MPIEYPAKQSWPPEPWKPIYDLYLEYDAWYSGDPNRLATVYSNAIWNPSFEGRMWAKELKKERATMLHIPIAGDIASTSADLLFSEAPRIRIAEAHVEKAERDAKNAQERLDDIVDTMGIMNLFLEAGETSAALSGVFLKVNWDREISGKPILNIVQADNALPEFKYGILTAISFHKTVKQERTKIWRLIERHEYGIIYNALYEGTVDYLGRPRPLEYLDETKGIDEAIETQVDGLLCEYIPNMKPNRIFRGSALGQSDYSGIEGLMDALDETYTNWMRDIKLGRGRIVVPQSWLKKDSHGDFIFDKDQEVFAALDIDPLSAQQNSITVSQFAIRTQEHRDTALDLMDRIVSSAGYSPQMFGLKIEGRAETGKALNIRERKSFVTKSKKERYWKPAIERIMYKLMQVDRNHLDSGITPYVPNVEFQDSISYNLGEVAESVEKLDRASALSIDTKVRMIHPDWEEHQIQTEIKRLMDQEGLSMPDPIQTGIG